MDDHVSLRVFIERILKENNLRRDDLRREDRRWVEDQFKALDKALALAANSWSSSTITTLFQVIAVLNMAIGLALAYLVYVKA